MAAEYLQRMGARMRERREELELSQEDVARLLPGKTTGNQVSRWERGLHRPGDDTMEALAKILKVDVAYFLAQAPDKSKTPELIETFDAGESGDSRLDRLEQALGRIQVALEDRNTRVFGILQDNSKQLDQIHEELLGRLDKLEQRLAKMEQAALSRVGAGVAAASTTRGQGAVPGGASSTGDQPGR